MKLQTDNEASLFWPAALMAILCWFLKKAIQRWAPFSEIVHHRDAMHNSWSEFLLFAPPAWMLCVVIKQPLEAVIMRLMYSIVAAEPLLKKKFLLESRTMTFGENYFLIEAYSVDMTDKLAIVKAFSCSASLVCYLSELWLNVSFVDASVFVVMFVLCVTLKLRFRQT